MCTANVLVSALRPSIIYLSPFSRKTGPPATVISIRWWKWVYLSCFSRDTGRNRGEVAPPGELRIGGPCVTEYLAAQERDALRPTGEGI